MNTDQFNGNPCTAIDGKPGGTGDKVHATARISSSLAKWLTAHSKRNADIFRCKPLTFACKIPDISSQTRAESCICVCTPHMHSCALMPYPPVAQTSLKTTADRSR